jgi:hypothetical protein
VTGHQDAPLDAGEIRLRHGATSAPFETLTESAPVRRLARGAARLLMRKPPAPGIFISEKR